MTYTPVGIPIAKEVTEAMRKVSEAFWYEWGSRYKDLSRDRKNELQRELTELLEACRAGAVGNTFYTTAEMDFSTLPAQNLLTGGDGVKVIDGCQWYLVNSANLQTAYINDGTHSGLYLRANGNVGVNSGGLLTGGAIYTSLTALGSWAPLNYVSPGVALETWVWMMFEVPHTPDANGEGAGVGFFTLTGAYTAAHMLRLTLEDVYTTTDGLRAGIVHSQCGSADSWGEAAGNHNDVACVRWRHPSWTIWRGASVNSDFPDRVTLAAPKISVEITPDGSFFITPGSQAHWAWCGLQSAGAGAQDILLKKIRVEVVPLIQSPTVQSEASGTGGGDEPYTNVAIDDGVIAGFGRARNLMCTSSGATLAGVETAGLVGGERVRVTFKYATVITAMGTPSSGAAIKTPRMGDTNPQDIHAQADDVVELQLRKDGAAPFWKVTGGSFT